MSKKRKNTPPKEDATPSSSELYSLKTDAVDRLVSADKKKYPRLTIENDPRRKYRGSFIDKIPSWIKALFIKFWFNGAVCYFILWGLGILVPNMTDMIVILAIVLGIVTDILVNGAFRFFAITEGDNDKWMMFPKKRVLNLFFNIFYSFGVLLVVIWLYNVVNVVANSIAGTESIIYLGVEPILFGLFYMAVDMCLVMIKNLFRSIIRDAKSKNGFK